MYQDVEKPFADGVDIQTDHESDDNGNRGLEEVDQDPNEKRVPHRDGVVRSQKAEKTTWEQSAEKDLNIK